MIFTKETLKDYPHLKDIPSTNDWDCSFTCQGKITKDFYKYVVEYFSMCEMSIYAIYVPLTRIADHNDWNLIKIQGCTHCGNDLRLEVLESIHQTELWIKNKKYNHWIPPIVPTKELEGNEYSNIVCHALGVNDIDNYKNKPVPFYDEAKGLFPDGLNWVHIKIG